MLSVNEDGGMAMARSLNYSEFKILWKQLESLHYKPRVEWRARL
jgi:hypothetical protein